MKKVGYKMSNQEIINKLLNDKLIYPIYESGSVEIGLKANVIWIIEFAGGGELIGSDGFGWDDICEIYRNG